MHGRITPDEIQATTFEESDFRVGGKTFPKSWFSELVRALWPIKGAVAVEEYTGVSDRTARNYQSAHSEPPGSVVCNLLRGNEGYRVLSWIMVGAAPTWWVNVHADMHMAKEYRALKPRLQEIIDGIEA